jgi:hypothetical protein
MLIPSDRKESERNLERGRQFAEAHLGAKGFNPADKLGRAYLNARFTAFKMILFV